MTTDLGSICYKKNYIKEALARVDFLNPIEQLNEALPLSGDSVLKKNFPITEKEEKMAHNIKFSSGGTSVENKLMSVEWTLWNKDRTRKVVVDKDSFLYVEYQYTTGDEFLENLKVTLKAVQEMFPEVLSKRFGVRYINNIELNEPDPYDWSDYLNPPLIGHLEIPNEKASISRSFHIQTLSFEDFNLIFQFGLHNPDYPARIKKKNFILDFDVYSSDVLKPEEVIDKSASFHVEIQKAFEGAITDKFREHLNE